MLTSLFKNICIPEFSTKEMVNKKDRCINNKTVDSLLKLSHYKFKTKLQNMCKNRKNNIFIVNESYTSKTCGNCGEINNKLGGQSIFKCKKCKIEIDRDINAARNICIKNCVLL